MPAAVSSACRFANLPDSHGIGQVEFQDGCPASKRLDGGRHLLRSFDVCPVGYCDVGTRLRQRQRNGPADATRRARHQHGTPAQRSLVAHQSIIVALFGMRPWIGAFANPNSGK